MLNNWLEELKIKQQNGHLDKYQNLKLEWLTSEKFYTDSTKRTYWIMLEKNIHYLEIDMGKDLSSFSKSEILDAIKVSPTPKPSSKLTLYTTIAMYFSWAIERGIVTTGNPCDSIFMNEIINMTSSITKSTYMDLSEFYNFANGLKCSDIDRMVLVLLRYGVKIDKIGEVKEVDIDSNSMVLNVQTDIANLKLPIDSMFLDFAKKAKLCSSYDYERFSLEYIDNGYIIKPSSRADSETMSVNTIYNKLNSISKLSDIPRIRVADFGKARKYDLLFEVYETNGKVTMQDIEKVLLTIDGISTKQRVQGLKLNFEAISDIKVITKK
ncbi:MAG: hypothetical protein ACLTDM_13045 [Clostridium butyricum]